jgi:hypothetical protein
MARTAKDLRLLYQRSGDRCAFPGCPKSLTRPDNFEDLDANLSEVAHIVAEKLDGPRGQHHLTLDERDKYDNLMLLCEEHHHIIDQAPHRFPVERLHQMKDDHEALMHAATGAAVEARSGSFDPHPLIRETLFSNLLPVLRLPRFVYSAPCKYNDSQEREAARHIVYRSGVREMTPFIIRNGSLFCFQNLSDDGSPFRDLLLEKNVERYASEEWWDDPNLLGWYQSLLNNALNKLTGRRGLNLNRKPRQYYFQPTALGLVREVIYRPLNQASATRQVVWQPIIKKTGLPRPYWLHRAVTLRFHRVGQEHWCLSIEPSFRVTTDGQHPLASENIGSKVTRKMARMFNYDFLSEVQFWRDFLSESQPRIVLDFGKSQHIILSSTMMQAEVTWPGIPEEHARPFKNVEYQDDLFSWAELSRLDREYGEEELYLDAAEESGNEGDEELAG